MTEPELKAEFQAWSQSRDAFQSGSRETNPDRARRQMAEALFSRADAQPAAPAGPADHQAKLRLPPFPLPDGASAPPPEPGPPSPSAAAATGPGRIAAASRRWLDARPDHFDAARPSRCFAAPSQAPRRPMTRCAARRDWILGAMEEQRRWPRRHRDRARPRPFGEDFLELHYAPCRPVVIEGALAGWPALTRWTPDYLRSQRRRRASRIQPRRTSSADFELHKDMPQGRMPFDAFMQRISATPGNDAYLTAYNSAATATRWRCSTATSGHLRYLTAAPA